MAQEFDRKGRKARWVRARLAEGKYNSRLQGVAKHIRSIIKGFVHGPDETPEPQEISALHRALVSYAKMIEPWATSVARYMLADVDVRNKRAWQQHGQAMGKALRQEIDHTPVGSVMRFMLAEQVRLIKSLPLEAAERVHAIVQQEMPKSTRSETIALQLLQSADIPKWRAKLIARTEVSRASTALTQARAMALGSEGYIWRTTRDGDVRETHIKLEGKYVRWSHPPKTDKSLDPYHAGAGPNCRCFPEPVLPDF